jgi:hypothetical protein
MPYKLEHLKLGFSILLVDQRRTGKEWCYLGTFHFDSGQKTEISISNAEANGIVFSDAFKFEFVE